MARFQFRKKPASDLEAALEGFEDDAPPSRFGGAMAMVRRLGAKLPFGKKAEDDDTFVDIETEPRRFKLPSPAQLAFPLAVLVTVLALSGVVVWLASSAETTLAQMKAAEPRAVVTVTLPDGQPRFPDVVATPEPEPEPEKKPVEEAEIDPVDVPVTLSPSRNEALLERGRGGVLPKVAADGTKAWQFYARPFPQDDPRPRIAIVMTDLGLSTAMLESAILRLPGAVTFAFPAGLNGLQPMIDRSRQNGHEVLLTIPMEPVGYPRNDPGPNTLLTTLPDERNIERLEIALASATGYVGVTSLSGTKFSTKAVNLRAVLQQLQRRGLLYADSWLVADSQATKLATELQLPRAVSDLLIDRVASAGGIDVQLQELERLALANGTAVGFAQPFPVTLDRLALWAGTLRDRGIVLAPISAVVNRQADR